MAWTSVTNSIWIEPIILYIAAIFWTLGYDTIYGLQDIHDDEIIGVKSTSIKFKNNPKIFVGVCYFLCVLCLLIMFLIMEINKYLLLVSIPFILYASAIFWTLGYDTIYGLQDIHDDEIIGVKSTSIKFKNNNFVGIFIFIFIFSFNFS